MLLREALKLIIIEVKRARRKHPTWPSDPVYQAAIVQEEAGELGKAALEYVQEGRPKWKMIIEAVHVAAVAIRFLTKK